MARVIARTGISPNALTIGGLVINLAVALLFSQGKFLWGGLLMIPGGALDFLDGSLARVTGKATGIGALVDSVIDRYSDLTILAGITFFYANQGQAGIVLLATITMIGCILVPYARARAEVLISSCRVGFMERPERWFLLALGAVLNLVPLFLWIVAILTHWTVVQRIHFAWRQLKREQPELLGEKAGQGD